MRKRLIERSTCAKKGSLGYTLTELLTVIGIIAVLCAIAIPSVIAIRDSLRFAQANNYAKSIFLAAQQNLTEIRSDGGLEPVQSAGGAFAIPTSVTSFPDEYRSEYVYTTTGTEAFQRILPPGSIDADLRDDQIVIEYNPLTGNVYSVFYYDKSDLNLSGQYLSDLPREKSARKAMMLGYYDGSGLNSSNIDLEQTQAIVEFVNDQEGIVRVKVPMPELFYGDYSDFAEALSISLSITGEQSMAEAAKNNTPVTPMIIQIKDAGTMTSCSLDVDGKTVIVEYAIDSLANRSSFVNYASNTQSIAAGMPNTTPKSLTTLLDETSFVYSVRPGENITIEADVTFTGEGSDLVQIAPGIISGVNPMFEYLQPIGDQGRYVLAVSNGRNLQNLNAISPFVAKLVDMVVFTDDIYWNDTVSYYNSNYAAGNTYYNTTKDDNGVDVYDEAPARALPYFVPIHNEELFGTARFIFPGQKDGGVSEDGGLGDYIWGKIKDKVEETLKDWGTALNNEIPTLTDELDLVGRAHATIQGNGHKVLNLRIDSTKYQIPNKGRTEETTDAESGDVVTVDYTGTFYATGSYQIVDYAFTGLFGYVNTPIDNLHVVNPIIKGYPMTYSEKSVPTYITIDLGIFGTITRPGDPKIIKTYNNPATGALVGASGYNTLITNCSTYIDKDARGYMNLSWGPYKYDTNAYQNWYGVMGEGAVGGLVGYAKSHLNTTGEINGQEVALAFSDCFAAVPVSGNMRGHNGKQFGYSNGVGAFIGNSQLTNFYNCYASGDVLAYDCAVYSIDKLQGDIRDWADRLTERFGISLDLLYSGRYSMGAGGFVGSNHGTRYTNCFSTGSVQALVSEASPHTLGGGGFVGFMSIDETFNYGHAGNTNDNIAQRTIFTNCYSVGKATVDKTSSSNTVYENFSGANGRIALNLNQSMTYLVGDYFRLYAPYYSEYKEAPVYGKAYYIYRDSYFLSGYHAGSQDNSSSCASPDVYSTFENLPKVHEKDTSWMTTEINEIKNIPLKWEYKRVGGILEWDWVVTETYETNYFNKNPELNNTYKDLYDEGFLSKDWNSATASTTHTYSLAAGQRYPFTKLTGLDYYGDWPSKPSDVGMAYFETYQDTNKTHYFFDKNHTEDAALTLREGDGVVVSEDGYAIFSADDADLMVTISDNDPNTADIIDILKVTSERYTVSSKAYHVFRLSDKLMNALPSDGEFYAKVSASHVGVSDTYTMYFNPNVAMSHVNPVENKKDADEPDAAPNTIYVRSARQFKGISTLDDFWGENYRYIQQLNIDASAWADSNKTVKLTSIGIASKPFNASYSAGYTIDNNGVAEEMQYKITGFELADPGIFGVIGEKGSVSNVIVEFTSDITAGSSGMGSGAVLAGISNGTIDNVALNLKGNVTLTAKTNTGLLAGLSSGAITDCDVTVAQGKVVTVTADNAGGFIGNAAGTADARTSLSNCTISLGSSFSAHGNNAGGLVGVASNLDADNLSVQLNTMSTDASYAGGLAGTALNSTFSGVSKNNSGANPVEVTLNSISATGHAAGAIAGTQNVTLIGMDVRVGTVTGNFAAGFLGGGVDMDATGQNVGRVNASNCTVTVTGAVTGVSGAAGAATSIGAQSVIERVTLTLTGATVSAENGNAAGYALEIKPEAYVSGCPVTLGGYNSDMKPQHMTTISAANGVAAGYACTIDGTVASSHVSGSGRINGNLAAGFAGSTNGSISSCYVSPALTQDKAGYAGNSNSNISVTGTQSAAGFVLTLGKKATVSNSYTLCSIDSAGTAAYGFAGSNAGTINRCSNNVDIAGGFAFVGDNTGLVTSSYGWYSNSSDDIVVTTLNGSCNNSYFANLKSEDVELYDENSVHTTTNLGALNNAALDGFTTGYMSCPYNPNIIPANYPYPMLRKHYGNWYTPPQYAYGVAYYEIYSDGTPAKLHLYDLSDLNVTEEDKLLTGQINLNGASVDFDNTGMIDSFGYAIFCKEGAGMLSGLYGEQLENLSYDSGKATYAFYALNATGEVNIPGTVFSSKTVTVDTRFADAIAPSGTYQVRTADHLANVSELTGATFKQTHDITADAFTTVDAFSDTFDGGKCSITVANGNSWMSEVTGTVRDVTMNVTGEVTEPIFGTVSGTDGIALKTVSFGSVGKNGALIGTVNSNVTTGAITSGKVSGKIFGDVNAGVEVTGAITIGEVSGQVFGDINGNVTVNGAISVGEVSGQVFGDTSAAVTAGAINTGSINSGAKVFGNVNGGAVQVACINTNGAAVGGQVFGNVDAGVTITNGITIGKLSGLVFGAVSADVTVTNNIQIASVSKSGKLINSVSGGETTLSGVTVDSGDVTVLFGAITGGTVTGSTPAAPIQLNSGNITTNLFASVSNNAVLQNFSVTTNGMGGSLIGGELNGTVSNVSISCSSANVGNSGGVLVTTMTSGSIDGCQVEVNGNITSAAPTFGGITGSVTAGSICNSTVSAETITVSAEKLGDEGNAVFGGIAGQTASGVTLTGNTVEADMNVTGKAGKLTVVGGMVGVNAGTIQNGTITSDIIYTQVTDDTIVDQVGIGGIVGWSQAGGNISDSIASSGSITMADGGKVTADHQYAIGGAVGYAEADITNVEVATQIGTEWAGGKNWHSTQTLGTTGITNNGPVGMFVGYAGDVTLSNCSSVEPTNVTYQFLGEAKLSDVTVDASYWASNIKATVPLTAYSDIVNSDGSFTATNGSISATMSQGVVRCSKVDTTLGNCTFIMEGSIRTQTYGVNDYFYTRESLAQNSYTSPEAITVAFNSVGSVKYTTLASKEVTDKLTDYYYYDSNNNVYGRVYVTREDERYIVYNLAKYTLWYVDSNGNNKPFDYVEIRYKDLNDSARSDLFTVNTSNVTNGNYLLVADGVAIGFDGSAIQGYTVKDSITQRNTEYLSVWDFTNDKFSNVAHASKVTAGSVVMKNCFAKTDVWTYLLNNVSYNNSSVFTPYKLTVGSYDKYTFALINNEVYLKQFITFS